MYVRGYFVQHVGLKRKEKQVCVWRKKEKEMIARWGRWYKWLQSATFEFAFFFDDLEHG